MFKIKENDLKIELMRAVRFLEQNEGLMLVAEYVGKDIGYLDFKFGYVDKEMYENMIRYSDDNLGVYGAYSIEKGVRIEEIEGIERRSYVVTYPTGEVFVSVRGEVELQEEALSEGGTFTFMTYEESEKVWWDRTILVFKARLEYIKEKFY